MLDVTNIQDTKRLIGLYKSISYDVNLICVLVVCFCFFVLHNS